MLARVGHPMAKARIEEVGEGLSYANVGSWVAPAPSERLAREMATYRG